MHQGSISKGNKFAIGQLLMEMRPREIDVKATHEKGFHKKIQSV